MAFEYRDLLPQGEDLERTIHVIAEESANRQEECRDQIKHESPVVTRDNALIPVSRPGLQAAD